MKRDHSRDTDHDVKSVNHFCRKNVNDFSKNMNDCSKNMNDFSKNMNDCSKNMNDCHKNMNDCSSSGVDTDIGCSNDEEFTVNNNTDSCVNSTLSVNKSVVNYDLTVVALGTGSKCLGNNKSCSNGGLVMDSHAEVIAKRNLQLFLITQMNSYYSGNESIFCDKVSDNCKGSSDSCGDKTEMKIGSLQGGKLNSENSSRPLLYLKEGVSFHFYISQTPCGDCSIFPKDISDEPPPKKFKMGINSSDGSPLSNCDVILKSDVNSFSDEIGKVVSESISDIHRTGAKCVLGSDPKGSGADYHVLGPLRTKPGSGDPSLSHSCSDKIFRWSVLGIQGGLLMNFLENPIYLQTITIGSNLFNKNAIERGLFSRFKSELESFKSRNNSNFVDSSPAILHCADVKFSKSKDVMSPSDVKLFPCASSISWYLGGKADVVVEGRKAGITKKLVGKPQSRVQICKYVIMSRIIALHRLKKNLMIEDDSVLDSITYLELKRMSISYGSAWQCLRDHVLKHWTGKDSRLLSFVL